MENIQEQINALIEERRMLWSKLAQGDYKIIKLAEATAAKKSLPYNAELLYQQRQNMRDRINEIEDELEVLYAELLSQENNINVI